jgi:thiol:disulfide interchange protein
MGKFLLFIAVVVVCYQAFGPGQGGKVDFPRVVISTPTPVKATPPAEKIRVILFTGTEWCPACKHLDSSVITNPAWREFAAQEIRFLSVDIPADRSRAKPNDLTMVSTYGVSAYPTMVVLDAAGKELSRQVGSGAPVENYKEWIRRHASFYRS